MKKNNYTAAAAPSGGQTPLEKSERFGCVGGLPTATAPPDEETLTSTARVLDEEIEGMILDPFESGEDRESLVSGEGDLSSCERKRVVLSAIEERDCTSVVTCFDEERGTGMLGPSEDLETWITGLDDIMGRDEDEDPFGFWALNEDGKFGGNGGILNEEKQSGELLGSSSTVTNDEKESCAISSNGESGERYSSSSMTSPCFDDEWTAEWDWQSVVEGYKLWDEGDQTTWWLWGSVDGEGQSG